MNSRRSVLPRWIALLALAAGSSRGWAQYAWEYVEYAPTTGLIPRPRYLKADVEAERDTFRSGGTTQQIDRLYVSSGIGLGWNGYVYHPYLLTYNGLFEPSYIWQERGATGAMNQSEQWVVNGAVTANVLSIKPYATSLSYSRAHDEVKYDFFNSAIVDSESRGISTGYRDGPVPVNVSFQQSHEESSTLNQRSTTDQSILSFRAKNEREKKDVTDLNYQYGEFARSTLAGSATYRNENSYHRVNVMDTEHYEKSVLRSTLLFNDVDSQNSSSETLNGTLNYNVRHSRQLHSYYNYSMAQFSGNNSDSVQNFATAGFNHQLYDSLSSGVEAHGGMLRSSSGGATLDSYSAGTDGSVNYNKRLGGWGGLSLGNNASYNFTDQKTSGSEVLIVNESHVVPNTDLVILGLPRDVAISSVTDSTGTITLQPGLDYTVNQTTDPWQIQVNNFGPNNVQPGDTILVTYTAVANPSGSYSTFADQSQVTLSFWGGHASVFGRYSFTRNQASAPGFILQDDEEFQAGADLNGYGFSLHGDFTDHHSTTYDNKSYNLAETYAHSLPGHASFGVNLNQQWNTFSFNSTSGKTIEHVTFYNSMLTGEWHPLAGLNVNVQAGLQQQRGGGNDQDLFAVRGYLNWSVGRLETRLGYEHDDQDFNGQMKLRDFIFLRIRRTF